MTDKIPLWIRETFDSYKRHLYETGPIIDQNQIDEQWSHFCSVLDELDIDYVEYWYYTGGKASDIQVYKYAPNYDTSTSDEDRADFLSDWDEMPISFVEYSTENDVRSIFGAVPFYSSLPGHKAGTSILISGIDEEEENIWELILIELSLIIELLNSRIIVKNTRFAGNVDKLTPAQYRVLKEIGNSKDRTNTAYDLGISPNTYDDHLRVIREKLTTSSRYRPSLERIRTNLSKYGIAGREHASLKKKISEIKE